MTEFNLDVSKPTIYLCGGFYGNWNEKVKKVISNSANILDPRDWRHIREASEYVVRDLDAIDKSDIIFAYRQKENPAIGMLCEIGYAHGKGKHIIFVGEYETSRVDRYYGFPRNMSNSVVNNIDAAIEELQKVVQKFGER